MFVPFESIPPTSRVWIFQSERKLSEGEKAIISSHLKLFTEEWAAHGQPLKASFELRHDQFIVLAADEGFNAPSGCSIDASVRVMKDIENQLRLDLFNRERVAFKIADEIVLVPLHDLRQKYSEGLWDEKTLTFNNLVDDKGRLGEEWMIPAGKTWLKRYVPKGNISELKV